MDVRGETQEHTVTPDLTFDLSFPQWSKTPEDRARLSRLNLTGLSQTVGYRKVLCNQLDIRSLQLDIGVDHVSSTVKTLATSLTCLTTWVVSVLLLSLHPHHHPFPHPHGSSNLSALVCTPLHMPLFCFPLEGGLACKCPHCDEDYAYHFLEMNEDNFLPTRLGWEPQTLHQTNDKIYKPPNRHLKGLFPSSDLRTSESIQNCGPWSQFKHMVILTANTNGGGT